MKREVIYLRKYDCRFESLGTELFFEDGFICEQISFQRGHEPALRDEKLSYAADMLTSMINFDDASCNRSVMQRLKELGIGQYQFREMLKCFLDGENYKDMVIASGVRVGLYEIQLGLRIWRENDPEHNAYTYLVIPLKRTFGYIVLRDLKKHDERVKIAWSYGMVTNVGLL